MACHADLMLWSTVSSLRIGTAKVNKFCYACIPWVCNFVVIFFEKNCVCVFMTLNELQGLYSRQGKVETLLVRPKRMEAATILDKVTALKDVGLEGDHYQNQGGARQVTLIQAEHLEVLAALLGLDKVLAEFTRRNIVIRGINLLSLKGKRFKIGEAIMEYSG